MAQAANMIMLSSFYEKAELIADNGNIKPGMLVQRTTTGCIPQNTSVGFFERLLATEDALQGNDVTVAYVTANPVQIAKYAPGCKAQVLAKAGTSYTVGTFLYPFGDGTFRATTGTPKQLAATVIEALDLSASGAVDTLVKVRLD